MLRTKIKLFCFIILIVISISSAIGNNTGKFKKFTANAMAPLNLPTAIYSLKAGIDWATGEKITSSAKTSYQNTIDQFKLNIKAAKNIGVNAISMDVWWGLVEMTDEKFDWYPYQEIFNMITAEGLQIQAIMSFHACGGNVGDNVNISIPSWIWSIAGNGAKYCGEQFIGNSYNEKTYGNPEIVSLWASNNNAVHEQYQQFMNAFETFVGDNKFADDIQAISISCGPSGECRYPSYDTYTENSKTFGQGYPTRGFLQCYSANAISSFQSAMKEKYKNNIGNLNKVWGTKLASFTDISPPTNGNTFFENNSEIGPYGVDFNGWYNGALVTHGQNMITDALTVFDDALAGVTVGIKIPGVHWQMGSNMPRSAELCAGLLNNGFETDVYNNGCGVGYTGLLNMIYGMNTSSANIAKSKINVYFTCLEMPNADSSPAYSWACSLVYGVGKQANKIKLQIKGENALSPNSGWSWNGSPIKGSPVKNKAFAGSDGSWAIINYAICNGYDGINILRVSDVTDSSQYGNFYGLLVQHSENNVPKDLPSLPTAASATADNEGDL